MENPSSSTYRTDYRHLNCSDLPFWDIVLVARYEDATYHGQVGSDKSDEIRGRFVGFADHVGML